MLTRVTGTFADLRVVMTSEQHCAEFEKLADVIKVRSFPRAMGVS